MVSYAAPNKNAERVVVQVRYRATRATGGNTAVKNGGVVLPIYSKNNNTNHYSG